MSDPIRRSLSLLARTHMNSRCADCRAKAPGFASYTLGVFICHACAEVHRQLPDDMSHVLSLMFDPWTPDQFSRMSSRGNLHFNSHFESLLPVEGRMQPDATPEERRQFIGDKYVRRKWWSATPAPCIMIPAPGTADAANAGASPSPDSASSADATVAAAAAAPASRGALRRERMNRAAPLNMAEQIEADLLRSKRKHPEALFDPMDARRAAEALARRNEPPHTLPPLHPTLSFVLTSSAVPSNPSLELVTRVLESCEQHMGLDRCRPAVAGEDAAAPLRCLALLVLDGYALDPKLPQGAKPKYKNGMLDEGSIARYEEYKARLRSYAASQPLPHLHLLVLELPFRQGFAGAVHQSLQFIASPYMVVLQHDWAFISSLPHSVWQLVQCMEGNKPSRFGGSIQVEGEGEGEEGRAQSTETQEESDATPSASGEGDGESDSPSCELASLTLASPSPAGALSADGPSPSPSPSASPPCPADPVHLPVNYITFQSSTTMEYLRKDYHDVARHVGKGVHRLHEYELPVEGGDPEKQTTGDAAAAPAPSSCASPTTGSSPIPLCPVYFWFDRNHLVRTAYYRQLVFGSYRFMRSAAFIEDTFGQLQLNMLRGSYGGTKKHRRHPFAHYASFIYYPDQGRRPLVDHEHGRKFMTERQREERHGVRDEVAREKQAKRLAAKEAAAARAHGGATQQPEEEEEDIDLGAALELVEQ